MLAGVLPGSNVRLCREDGWPSDYCNDAVFVRTVNSPPPLPASTFCRGELVLPKFQLDTLAEGWLVVVRVEKTYRRGPPRSSSLRRRES